MGRGSKKSCDLTGQQRWPRPDRLVGARIRVHAAIEGCCACGTALRTGVRRGRPPSARSTRRSRTQRQAVPTNAVSSARCASSSFGVGPGETAVLIPSTPCASYHWSRRFTEPRVASSWSARSTTRTPSMYPRTAFPRRHSSRSPASLRSPVKRRRAFRAAGVRRSFIHVSKDISEGPRRHCSRRPKDRPKHWLPLGKRSQLHRIRGH
jgi:hypothetical protein